METKNLDKFLKVLVNCTQCGYCKDVCPVFDEVGWDSSAARGKMSLAYGLQMDDIEPDESVLERLYQCTTCADCFTTPPSISTGSAPAMPWASATLPCWSMTSNGTGAKRRPRPGNGLEA